MVVGLLLKISIRLDSAVVVALILVSRVHHHVVVYVPVGVLVLLAVIGELLVLGVLLLGCGHHWRKTIIALTERILTVRHLMAHVWDLRTW